MSGHPETLTLSAFAGYLGCVKSYVTKLKHADRLVLTPDGRQVKVAESLARIRDTADPARGAPALPTETPPAGDAAEPTDSYQAARAVKERYLALSAKRDYEIACGKLLEASHVERYLANAVVILRTRIEAIATLLGPQLAAESDVDRCIALLADEHERCLSDLVDHFRRESSRGAA